MADVINSVMNRIQTLLRFIAPGYVTLIVFGCGTTAHGRPSDQYWLFLISGALLGVLIYGIHTAVLLRFAELLVLLVRLIRPKEEWGSHFIRFAFGRASRHDKWYELFSDLDNERWLRRRAKEPIKGIQDELDTWSAMLNFMYCCSYPMIWLGWFGNPIGELCGSSLSVGSCTPCFWKTSGLVIYVVALYSSVRIVNLELWVRERYRKTGPDEIVPATMPSPNQKQPTSPYNSQPRAQ